jgi:hypothetical protein
MRCRLVLVVSTARLSARRSGNWALPYELCGLSECFGDRFGGRGQLFQKYFNKFIMIAADRGGEGDSQSPLKGRAFSTFQDQNPPFELRPENGISLRQKPVPPNGQ